MIPHPSVVGYQCTHVKQTGLDSHTITLQLPLIAVPRQCYAIEGLFESVVWEKAAEEPRTTSLQKQA